ncbi:hypothetical protein RF11_11359 [Thelohanellus kitauei]|uniref:Uncharacterized protein n=1 Tax=Thelohanellus kitauei TaxID=669202 RepID=A0A0C2MNJ1_THEKT|nr:hypothetical protein RF11_11359 [Thelohanellus kitauei]
MTDIIHGLANAVKIPEFKIFIVNNSLLIDLFRHITLDSQTVKLKIIFFNILNTLDQDYLLYEVTELWKQINFCFTLYKSAKNPSISLMELVIILLDVFLAKNKQLCYQAIKDSPLFMEELQRKIDGFMGKSKHLIVYTKVKDFYFTYVLGNHVPNDLGEGPVCSNFTQLSAHLCIHTLLKSMDSSGFLVFESQDIAMLLFLSTMFKKYVFSSDEQFRKFIHRMVELCRLIVYILQCNPIKKLIPTQSMCLKKAFLDMVLIYLFVSKENHEEYFEIIFQNLNQDPRLAILMAEIYTDAFHHFLNEDIDKLCDLSTIKHKIIPFFRAVKCFCIFFGTCSHEDQFDPFISFECLIMRIYGYYTKERFKIDIIEEYSLQTLRHLRRLYSRTTLESVKNFCFAASSI